MSGPPRSIRVRVAPTGAHVSTRTLPEIAAARDAARENAAYARGLQEGRRIAAEEAAGALHAAADRLDEARERAEEVLAASAVELALEITRQLLRIRLEAGEYDLERIVRATLASGDVGRGAVTVHLNPRDLEGLDAAAFRTDTRLVADPDLPRGAAHVSSSRGLLVRDLDAALEEIREQLLEDVA